MNTLVEPRRELITHINRVLGGNPADGPIGATRRFSQLVNECTSATAQIKQLEVENNFLRDEIEHLNRRLAPQPNPNSEAMAEKAAADAQKRRERWAWLSRQIISAIETELAAYQLPDDRELIQSAYHAVVDAIETHSCMMDAKADLLESAE